MDAYLRRLAASAIAAADPAYNLVPRWEAASVSTQEASSPKIQGDIPSGLLPSLRNMPFGFKNRRHHAHKILTDFHALKVPRAFDAWKAVIAMCTDLSALAAMRLHHL